MALYEPLQRLDFVYYKSVDPAERKLFLMSTLDIPVYQGEYIPAPNSNDINTADIYNIKINLFVEGKATSNSEKNIPMNIKVELPVVNLNTLDESNPVDELVADIQDLIDKLLKNGAKSLFNVTTKVKMYPGPQLVGKVKNHISQNGNVEID